MAMSLEASSRISPSRAHLQMKHDAHRAPLAEYLVSRRLPDERNRKKLGAAADSEIGFSWPQVLGLAALDDEGFHDRYIAFMLP